MIVLKITPTGSGAYKSQTWNSKVVPEGYSAIPDGFIGIWEQYKPFVTITAEAGVITDMQDNPEARAAATPIESVRAAKIAELSAMTEAAIKSGADVETAYGVEHFSLDDHDQLNISNLAILLGTGVAGYPYHADGKACVMYSAEDLLKIVTAATQWVTYHTTYFNFTKVWAQRETDPAVINGIPFEGELPEDLNTAMTTLLAAVGGGS